MNPPPNGVWKIMKPGAVHKSSAWFWDGSGYVDILDIGMSDQGRFMQNPEYAKLVDGVGAAEIDVDQGSTVLEEVEKVATRIKKVFNKETYDTPTKRRNAIFIILFAAAIVTGVLIYTKRIKL